MNALLTKSRAATARSPQPGAVSAPSASRTANTT